jgi:hypothetical protein
VDTDTFKALLVETDKSNAFKALPVDTNTPKSTIDLAEVENTTVIATTTSIKSNIKNTIVPAIDHCFIL